MNFPDWLRVTTFCDCEEWCVHAEVQRLAAQDHEALVGYEAWEAELLHPDGLSHLTPPLYDRLMDLQEQRNAAIRAGEELKQKHE